MVRAALTLAFRRGIAWSKWGSIASITSNKAAIELRNLRRHPDDGSWALSEPTVTPPFTTTLDGGPLKHLSWSPSGSDLAVIDAAGRVTILGLWATLNKPTLHRPSQVDPADDLHRVVGCYWLNLAPLPPARPVCLSDGNAWYFLTFDRNFSMVQPLEKETVIVMIPHKLLSWDLFIPTLTNQHLFVLQPTVFFELSGCKIMANGMSLTQSWRVSCLQMI